MEESVSMRFIKTRRPAHGGVEDPAWRMCRLPGISSLRAKTRRRASDPDPTQAGVSFSEGRMAILTECLISDGAAWQRRRTARLNGRDRQSRDRNRADGFDATYGSLGIRYVRVNGAGWRPNGRRQALRPQSWWMQTPGHALAQGDRGRRQTAIAAVRCDKIKDMGANEMLEFRR
jgi:hypothetical protein